MTNHPAILIARREVAAYLKSPLGYIVAFACLAIGGLLFNGFALGQGEALSSDVLRRFFQYWSGIVMVASVFLSMRLFAEERQTGTLVLLQTAPVSEGQIVLGKFLSAFTLLVLLCGVSVYLPLLVAVNGNVGAGQLLAGYLGVLALGATTTAMATFASATAKNQVLAAVIGGAIVVGFLIPWMIAEKVDPPLSGAVRWLALWDKHFWPTFSKGTVRLADLVFFGAFTWVFLFLTTKVLQTRRWAG